MILWSAEARFRFSAIRSASGLSIVPSPHFVVAQHTAAVRSKLFPMQDLLFTSHQSPVTSH